MNTICRDIFRAIHERKWLSIEYKNGKDEVTKYWIGIMEIDPIRKSMHVMGLHLGQYTTMSLYIYIDSILSSAVIEGSYFETKQELIDDITYNQGKYRRIFDNIANLKVLNYLVDCNKMDSVPYKTDYALIEHLDGEWQGTYKLTPEQFRQIVSKFQYGASQGNIAMSLVPIIRGRSLMLVGDPQQLSPVILLNPIDNEKLKRIYGVTDEYDYIKNSIYKTYLACDAVSEEILLSHHYRCNKKIISFNNKKYYNNKLIINSPDKEANPLIFKNIPANTTNYKNTAPQEVEEIISFIKEHPDKSIGIITPFTNQKELINKALKDNGMENIPCGTVHAFQGDEKDVVLFSLAITQQTYQGTYDWLKNNKELINVATSRAKDQLVILSDIKELKRLHSAGDDDIYELVDYVQTNGEAQVTARETSSRALGIKPYSTQTEAAFLTTLNHALDNVLNTNNRCVVQREVSIAHVFQENESYDDLFYTGRFDFVVYEKGYRGQDMPILAIELDGKEHKENAIVRARDEKKNAICRAHGFELLRVENSYARRYNYIKNIQIQYFKSVR